MARCLTLPATSGALLTAGSQSTAQRGCALVRAGPGLGADRQAGAQAAQARPQVGSRRHASRGTEAPACTDKKLGSEPRPSARAAPLTPSLRGPGTTPQRSPRPPLPPSPGRRRHRDSPGPPARGGSAHVRRAPPPGGSAPSPQDAPGAASWRSAFKPANRRPAPRPPRRV
ncbi:translation initiation factor IF-2 [Mustela putorius furo]|uniref:Translation initiation factor IF-2 n=1 Tax=Mustela putorius furo TaxID=9669 RepID=A0A8U0T9Z3_MUSPF|nr:translation initiation factor IF-2 [Mustela putorius furo]